MRTTCWGSPITFGWELEGQSADVIDWYEPDADSKQKIAERMGFVWDKADRAQQKKFVHDCIETNQLVLNGLRWHKFVRRDDAPTYLRKRLKEESNFAAWEVNSKVQLDLEAVFVQLTEATEKFPAGRSDLDNVHVHVVFDSPNQCSLPPDVKAPLNGLLVGLFQLLNDYASLKDAAQGNDNFTGKFVGNNPVPPRDIFTQLSDGQPLDRLIAPNTYGGPLKFNFVGFRDLYVDPDSLADRPKLGFEIRGGFAKHRASFFRLLGWVVEQLERLWPAGTHEQPLHVRAPGRRPPDAGDFSIADHVAFYNLYCIDTTVFTPELRDLLMGEAQRLVRQKKADPFESDPVTVYMRWLRAFFQWEKHPALRRSNERRALVVLCRNQLIDKVRAFFKRHEQARAQHARLVSAFGTHLQATAQALELEDGISPLVAEFFADTGLYKYL